MSKPAALRALRLLEELDVLDSVPEGPGGQLRWLATEVFELLTNESESAAS